MWRAGRPESRDFAEAGRGTTDARIATLRPRHAQEAALNGFLMRDGVTRFVEGGLMDLIYIALGVGFFALTWLLVKLCERV